MLRVAASWAQAVPVRGGEIEVIHEIRTLRTRFFTSSLHVASNAGVLPACETYMEARSLPLAKHGPAQLKNGSVTAFQIALASCDLMGLAGRLKCPQVSTEIESSNDFNKRRVVSG